MKRFGLIASTIVLALGMVASNLLPVAQATSDNIISNPSVETADSTGTAPQDWLKGGWGTNTRSLTYVSGGAQDGTRSLKTQITAFTNGDAKWYFKPVTVTPNTKMAFSDYYMSNVASQVVIQYADTTGKFSYVALGNPAIAPAWTQATYTFTTPANVANMTVFHLIAKVGWLQTDNYSLQNVDVTATPTATITAPAAGATVSGTAATISANTSGPVAIAGVQFKVDGANYGAEDTTTPYSIAWDTTKVANGSHSLTAVARGADGVTGTSPAVSVNVNNVTPPVGPTVSITSPANGATVSAITPVAANASDSTGIAGVQFKLDGTTNLGAEDTTAPYSVAWDTTPIANGSHSLTAVARNTGGTTTTSAPVSVNVSNQPTPPQGSNLIANPSVETVSAANPSLPDKWTSDKWGTNTATFSYPTTGHTGNRSVRIDMTSYSSGDAKWDHTPVSVTPGSQYQFTDYYQSNVATEIDMAATMSDGSTQYYWITSAPASTSWTQVKGQFTAPVGAKSVTLFHVIYAVGYLVTDDFSLTPYTPAQFNRGIVTLTFDDGFASQYTNGLPKLQKYGLNATMYLCPGLLDTPDYMTLTQAKAFQARGDQIASHTVDHPHLTTLTAAQVTQELQQSQIMLQNQFGIASVPDFATPYGEYNQAVLDQIKTFYRSHRSVETGYNTKDNFDIYNIRIQGVYADTTQAQLQAWVDQAAVDHSWLVLMYHRVEPSTSDYYNVTPANLDAQLNYIKTKGVAVETLTQALAEVQPQLGH
jgi:peptidoglycan/xylan/chitin deacetylase (PgdA/CDA1 family)